MLRALMAVRPPTARAIQATVARSNAVQLFYVGAGTSGRLGVLDASECPVTFNTSPDLVQGILAAPDGVVAIGGAGRGRRGSRRAGNCFRGVSSRDVVIGIAASGTTPFVWGALNEHGDCGATTVLIAFNPFLRFPRTATGHLHHANVGRKFSPVQRA